MKLDIKAWLTLGGMVAGLAIAFLVVNSTGDAGTDGPRQAEQEQVKAVVEAHEVASQAEPAVTQEAKSKFVHYRVGQRNVKSIYADADEAVWVGYFGWCRTL